MNPIDVVAAAPWTRVAFTTYALSLSFFEAVILDALLRGRGRGALILSDPEGVRAALSEEGARRVGRDYEVAPVACNLPGVFHPKISMFSKGDDAHLLVGSGNLTFSGWGGNLEVIEHLHPSFAADAFDDAAGFFDALATSDMVTTSAGTASQEIAEDLRKAADRGTRSARFQLLHSLNAPIADQIALYADDLGGAARIVVASPYFDLEGNALTRLAAELGCDNILLHAHPAGSVRGGRVPSWPYEAKEAWGAVIQKDFGADDRRLHAKSIEVVCRKGRLLLAGSANATEAGLFGRNIEASVLRVQRDVKSYWQSLPGLPPTRPSAADEETEAADNPETGILTAKLDGDTILGRVLTPVGTGEMDGYLRSLRRADQLGKVLAGVDGQFRIPAAEVELEALQTGRLVIRLEQDRHVWEGFLSITVTLELIRRTGSIASKLIAMLGGTETPADVAAILAWFKEDPARLPTASVIGPGGHSADDSAHGATFVSLVDLAAAPLNQQAAGISHGDDHQFAWRRAMELIRASFVQVRGPWPSGDATDDDGEEESAEAQYARFARYNRENERSRRTFGELLDTMLDSGNSGRHAPIALSLAHFLTDRIRPEASEVRSWVQRILHQVAGVVGPERDMIVATALLFFSLPQQGGGAIRARRFFIKRGEDPRKLTANPSSIPAFVEILHPTVDLEAELGKVCAARTMGEQVTAYVAAARGQGPEVGYESLRVSRQWPRLQRAMGRPEEMAKFSIIESPTEVCPRRQVRLPAAARSDLRSEGVAVCDCCGRIILNTDC